jgi:hypothetical protein
MPPPPAIPMPRQDITTQAAAQPTVTPAAATVQSVARIEQAIRDRVNTDHTFMNWWLYTFLVNPITLGIAGIYFFYQRMARVDAYSRRKSAYYAALVEYTERSAEGSALAGAVRPMTDQLRADLAAASQSAIKPIGAGLNFVLVIVTLGLWAIVVYYKVNRAWNDRQRFEAHFDDRLSQAWLQLGILRHPITFMVDQGKDRNFWIWLVLSIVTLGIWAIVWDYRVWRDPDRLYPEFHAVEDAVLQIVRTA